MKHDMGGAAGVLGGFFGAVELKSRKNVTCILCLAENAIGPNAFRNDGTCVTGYPDRIRISLFIVPKERNSKGNG